MSKRSLELVKSPSGRLCRLHSVSTNNGKTPLCKGVAIPIVNSLEGIAGLVEEGYLTEPLAVSLFLDAWAVFIQARVRLSKGPKAKVTDSDVHAFWCSLSDSEIVAFRKLSVVAQQAAVKARKLSSVESPASDPSKIVWLDSNLVPNSFSDAEAKNA
jgi:hypothetical protein